ncbi:ribosomal L29 protein-domain-containing protein [Entophlyctis helioformis]|nr:ribosomal L29 protein-domain-containing protein [Entophlyctis helioformis]
MRRATLNLQRARVLPRTLPHIEMTVVKAKDIRTQNKTQLTAKLTELKQELANLRVQQVSGNNSNKLSKIGEVRKSIARVLTVMSHAQRTQLHALFKGKKYLPLDLRTKKTRAIRRRLTAHESSRKTVRQIKKETHFPLRKYAVKA